MIFIPELQIYYLNRRFLHGKLRKRHLCPNLADVYRLSFHPMPTSFTPTVPNSYRALVYAATLPTVKCLIWSFCPLDQMFADGSLQIPPRDGHSCLRLCDSAIRAHSGLAPVRQCSCRAYQKKHAIADVLCTKK